MDNLPSAMAFDPYMHGLVSGHADMVTPYLGPAPRDARINHHNNKSHAKWNFPENYVGESLTMADTVEDVVLTAQWDFWTTAILPYYRTDDIHVQWSEWQNNVHYMGITPHQTASKVVTQKRTIRKASIVRRGKPER